MPAFWHIAEYARILNMSDDISDVVHSIRSLYKLLISYRDRNIQNIVKHLRRSVKKKKKMEPGIRALRQTFRQKHKKKRPRRKTFWSFFCYS